METQAPTSDANLDRVWAVYRQDTGECVESGFQTEDEARSWAEENLPTQRPDAWWFLDQVSLVQVRG